MFTYVERLLEPMPEAERQTLSKFLRDSRSLPSFDNPLPDLLEPSPLLQRDR